MTNKLKVIELFAGIGTQRMALRNIGINHEVVAIAEIDKYAIKSYNEIHGETLNLGDISKIQVENIPDCDLMTYSFPCQSISASGLQQGLTKGSGTQSSLLWECQRIIEAKEPKYLLMENVKNLVSKKFKPDFEKWLEYLESLGYTNYYQILNAKHYGIPQNRERVFCVSILGEHKPYEFPQKQQLTIRLKDVLENHVDEKYYLSQKMQDRLNINVNYQNDIKTIGNTKSREDSIGQRDWVYSPDGIIGTLTATDYKQPKQIIDEPKINQIFQYDTPTRKNSNRFRGYDTNGIAPTIGTMQGGGLEPHVIDNLPLIAASRGRYKENPFDRTPGIKLEQRIEINSHGTSNTITSVQKDNYVIEPTYRIRKLTPKECWRLMGVSDSDFEKAQAVNSNTQLYKQAGNAIVVNVLEGIFGALFNNGEFSK